jgi:U2-associated protein SR140
VADIIVASLLVDGTAVPRKVARLHLICDILHNSAAPVPSAWKFRQEFQSRLGIVFDHLANIYHSFPGRITADLFKKQITTVVDIWEDWIVFPLDFTSELRRRLEGAVSAADEAEQAEAERLLPTKELNPSRFKTSSFKLATESEPLEPSVRNTESDGEPMDVSGDEADRGDVDGKPVEDIDVDGVPVEDIDVDGVPVEDVDVDGVPVEDVDLDGLPVDDVDGVPVDDVDADGALVVDNHTDNTNVDGIPIDDVDGEPLDI